MLGFKTHQMLRAHPIRSPAGGARPQALSVASCTSYLIIKLARLVKTAWDEEQMARIINC